MPPVTNATRFIFCLFHVNFYKKIGYAKDLPFHGQCHAHTAPYAQARQTLLRVTADHLATVTTENFFRLFAKVVRPS